jgi:ribosome biogenesis GTPase
VVLLTKADLAEDLAAALELIAGVAPGVQVIAVSAISGLGMDQVASLAAPDRTLAFLGSSGVGKSTLINRLLGAQVQAVAEVRAADERGRHTTTRRELIPLPSGGALLDTPGMRELGLWDAAEGLALAFPEVQELAQRCRFNDCTHESEPGCAVAEAITSGALDADRAAAFRKLARELAALAARTDPLERERKKSYDKSMERALRTRLRDKGR